MKGEDRNRYSPPSSFVDDVPIDGAAAARPGQVVIATLLLWAGLGLGIAKWAESRR